MDLNDLQIATRCELKASLVRVDLSARTPTKLEKMPKNEFIKSHTTIDSLRHVTVGNGYPVAKHRNVTR